MNKPEYSYRYRDKNREKCRAMWRRIYYENPEKNKLHSERRKGTNKENARKYLRNEIQAGRIIKPNSCEKCGTNSVLHGHHTDYNKPLEVKWLCSFCHGLEHRMYKDNIVRAALAAKEG